MADKKKLTRKEKIALQQQSPEKRLSEKKQKEISRSGNSLRRWLMLLTGIIAFTVYSNTLNHQYVLDDFGLIPENWLTKKGISAWPEIFSSTYRAGTNMVDISLYRPLSKAMFALEWQLAPDTPALGHWVNVVFFALTCMLLFKVLTICFRGNLLIPFMASVLFATHPIHTEVVANIKSRDEIMCLFFCLSTVYFILHYVRGGNFLNLIAAFVLYFMAFLSKESAITWLAVIPLMVYFFNDDWKKRLASSMIPLALAAAVFLLIRSNIVSAGSGLIAVVDNSLVDIKDSVLRTANAIFLLGVYLKQLVYPVEMVSDGSYNHFKVVGLGSLTFILSLAAYLAIGIYAMIRFRKKDILAFAALYFLITLSLVSNVFFLIGTNYGERLLFMPSLGFVLAVSVLIAKIFPVSPEKPNRVSVFFVSNKFTMGICAAITIFYSVNTYARNKDWYSDKTLFSADIRKVPESAHMQFYFANHISSDDEIAKFRDSVEMRQVLELALHHLDTSIMIYPNYPDAFQRRGFIHHKLKNYKAAEENYIVSIEKNPTFPVAQNNYANLLFETGRYEEALKYFKEAYKLNPYYSHAVTNIGAVYGVYGHNYKQQALQDSANRDKLLEEARKNFLLAVDYFLIAIDLDPESLITYQMLATTYRNLGDEQNAAKYKAIGEKLQGAKN